MGSEEQGAVREEEQDQEYKDIISSGRKTPRDLFCDHGNTQK